MKKGANRGVIVFGSARTDGNTGLVVKQFAQVSGFHIIDLNSRDIGYFDYERPVREDDFISTIESILQYEIIVFATPVYWYSMSAVLKTFFDRISDLLKWHKVTGRMLCGKAMALISTSEKQTMDPVFAFPFERTATYLGMQYLGYLHCPTLNSELPASSIRMMHTFHSSLEDERNARFDVTGQQEFSRS